MTSRIGRKQDNWEIAMRRARIKPTSDCYMHAYNRVAGSPGFFPFGRKEKRRFVSLLHKLERYYVIDVVSYQVMSNHFHLVVHVPIEEPSPEETCRRYEKYYCGKRHLRPGSKRCRAAQKRLRDISAFMHDLQAQFSTWFNSKHDRLGSLWAGRFKNTILETGLAVWNCVKYVTMNPVRAQIVSDPGKYRFGSWGAWCTIGVHPFKDRATRHLLQALPWPLKAADSSNLHEHLQLELSQMPPAGCEEREKSKEESRAGVYEPFTTRVDRKVRYWIDGIVIGSRNFVTTTLDSFLPSTTGRERVLTSTCGLDSAGTRLTAYRLRKLV